MSAGDPFADGFGSAAASSIRIAELQRQLVKANALVPERTGSAADDRFSAHAAMLRKFLDGSVSKDALVEESATTQHFLARARV